MKPRYRLQLVKGTAQMWACWKYEEYGLILIGVLYDSAYYYGESTVSVSQNVLFQDQEDFPT